MTARLALWEMAAEQMTRAADPTAESQVTAEATETLAS